jgi:hypothetical protein
MNIPKIERRNPSAASDRVERENGVDTVHLWIQMVFRQGQSIWRTSTARAMFMTDPTELAKCLSAFIWIRTGDLLRKVGDGE